MKVLVIDSDPNAQRILSLLLQRMHCTVLVTPDEDQGLKEATAEDQPELIICDWKEASIDAPAFCKKLRAAKLRKRPYIFLLTAKGTKEEIAQGLDSGADDYILKPFNLIEIQARMRAAMRIIGYQNDLQREAEEAAAMAERNKLLGEMLTNQSSSKITKIMKESAAAVTSVKTAKATTRPSKFSHHEVRYLLSSSLLELKLVLESTKERLTPIPLKNEAFCSWAPLLLCKSGQWSDVLLSGSLTNAATLFEKAMARKPNAVSETLAFMSEIIRIICAGLTRTLQIKDFEVISPIAPHTLQPALARFIPELPQDAKSHELSIDGGVFHLSFSDVSSPRLELDPGELRACDLLAEQLPPPDVSEVPLFKKGTLMNLRFVEKMHEQAELTCFSYKASVYRPSTLAKSFLQR